MSSEKTVDGTPPMTIVEASGFSVVRLSGDIDEAFAPAAVQVGFQHVLFDLKNVRRVSSFGIREWVSMIQRLEGEGRALYFFNCPIHVTNQFNMVSGFRGSGRVITFWAPYFCERCDHEREFLVDSLFHHELIAKLSPPPAQCICCGELMEFDDVPHNYLEFAASQPKPDLPAGCNTICRRLNIASRRGPGTPFYIKKAVSERTTVLKLSGLITEVLPARSFDGIEGHLLLDLCDVELVSEKGAQRLVRALKAARSASDQMWIVRAPPAVLAAMAAYPELSEFSSCVHSLWLCHECTACEHTSFERILRGEARRLTCPSCSSPMRLASPAELLSVLDKSDARAAIDRHVLAAALDTDRFLRDASYDPTPVDAAAAVDTASVEGGGILRPGSRLGKYQIERLLGAGGMAEVFLARQHGPAQFEKEVVIKRILPHLASDESFVGQFLDEARLVARFNHPNIVQVFELQRERDLLYIVMEYVDGEDLASVMRKCSANQHAVPRRIALRLLYDLLQGLHSAHEFCDRDGQLLGVVHRDVSLSNVLVSRDGAVKLVDFGIAKARSSLQQTRQGLIKGKVAYLSPEQVLGHEFDRRVDVYAAGVVLFELLSGRRPFWRHDEISTLHAVLSDGIPSILGAASDLDAELDEIVRTSLAKKPDERYRTAKDFAGALNRYAQAKDGGMVDHSDVAAWLRQLAKHEPPAAPRGVDWDEATAKWPKGGA